MKRKLILLALLALLAFAFTACSSEDDTPAGETVAETPAPTETAAPNEEEGPPSRDVPAAQNDEDIIFDLSAINLIDHDLGANSLFEHTTLYTIFGFPGSTVSIVSEAELFYDNGFIFNDAWAIELYYFAMFGETAVETVIWSVEEDLDMGYFFDDSELTFLPIRASADSTMAYTVIFEQMSATWDNWRRICFYIAQNVPGSQEVVLLDVVLFLDLWEDHIDDPVLAELSALIGIDFASYIVQFSTGRGPVI